MSLEKKTTKLISFKRINDIAEARIQAYDINVYINHLMKPNFYEVREEFRDKFRKEYTGPEPEELLNIAISTVLNRKDKSLNKKILDNIDYIKASSSKAHAERQTA